MRRKSHKGGSLLNRVINKLPFELHLPGYQYCGPGTKLEKRLARADSGINNLDKACKEHDLVYHNHKDLERRHKADKVLAEKAWEIVGARDSSLGERTSAWMVTNAMKAKRKLGSGLNKRKKRLDFKNLVKLARVKNMSSVQDASKMAYIKAKKSLKGEEAPLPPRILPIPKSGGFLPFLVPIMAGLSAIGSLAGGAASVAKAVNEARDAKRKLDEQKRHNLTMEAQKIGEGLYLKPFRKGYGLYIGQTKRSSKRKL